MAFHFIVLTKTYLHGRNFTDGMIYVSLTVHSGYQCPLMKTTDYKKKKHTS